MEEIQNKKEFRSQFLKIFSDFDLLPSKFQFEE